MTLSDLRRDWEECQECGLADTREKVVFGKGNPNADILIIGESPGEYEDHQGQPFVGPAGDELHLFLSGSAMNWKEDTYITNILGCRPFTIERRRDKNNKVNRPPTRIERDACWPRLFETIYRVDPLLIITMGKIAANTLLVNTSTLPSLQGRVHTCIIQGRYTEVRYPVLCMYPISHLTRSAGAKRSNEGPWQETYENFYEVTEILDHLRHAYWGIPRPDRGDD